MYISQPDADRRKSKPDTAVLYLTDVFGLPLLKGGANPAERCTAMELWEMRDISTRPATALECFGMQVHRRQREAAYILRHQIATLDDEFYAAEEEIRRLLS